MNIVERAKAALESVTEGPWRWATVDDDEEYLLDATGARVPSLTGANTEFIAAARTLVPELVAEVERLTPRSINNLNEAAAYPVGTYFRDAYGQILKRERKGWSRYDEHPRSGLPFEFPAVVLWSPEVSR